MAGDVIERGERLWSRNFQLYFALRTVSLFGDSMMPVAVMVGVLHDGYGPTGVSSAFAAWTAAIAALVPFGGVLADRFTPRRMMIIADITRAITQSLLAVSMVVKPAGLWQILCLLAVSGAATAVFQPGVASVLPHIARNLQRANGVLRVGEALVTSAGPAVAGVLAAGAGAAAVLAVDAATFVVSASCLLVLRLGHASVVASDGSMGRNLLAGWREFRARRWIWHVILLWSLCGLLVFGPTAPLGGFLIIGEHGSFAYGMVTSMFGVGTVGGGLLAIRNRSRRPLVVGAGAVAASAACPAVVAFPLPVVAIAIGFLCAGIGYAFWDVVWLTTMQTHVPPAVLNRVYAYDVAASTMSLPIGAALAGPAAHVVGIRHVLLAATFFGLAASAGILASPAARALTRVPTGAVPEPGVGPA